MQFTLFGSDGRNLGVAIDGQTFNNPVTGAFDPYSIPIEYVGWIQTGTAVSSGASAVLGAGESVDFVTRQYVAYRPISKVRYLQGPYNHTLTDGLFSQNITRRTNLTIGFQRQVADGRYRNADFDSWSFRSRLRFNFSDRLNLMVSYLYWKSSRGLNGGVFTDSSTSVFNEVEATVRLERARETTERHDVMTLLATRLLPDTLFTTRLRLFFTSGDREYDDASNPSWNGLGTYGWKTVGGSLEQSYDGPWYTAAVGGRMERRSASPETSFSPNSRTFAGLTGSVAISLPGGFRPSLAGRHERIQTSSQTSYDASLAIPLLGWLSADIKYGRATRTPTLQEMSFSSWAGGNPGSRPEHNTTSSASLRANFPNGSVLITLFHRKTDNWRRFRVQGDSLSGRYFNVFGEVIPSLRVTGAALGVDLHLWHLDILGTLNLTTSSVTSGPWPAVPRVSSIAEIAWRDDYFDESLRLRAGLRGRFMGMEPPLFYQPALDLFAQADRPDLGAHTQLDLFIVFQLGDAYVQVTWENFTNERYYLVPTYPALDQNFKIGINWSFIN